jgi:para-nitrobenzyl esterase
LRVVLGVAAAGLGTGLTALPARAQIQQGILITTTGGQVQGHLNGATREFLGIPFAAPPVGALRWRPPAPPASWNGVLDAATYSTACPQGAGAVSDPSLNEDCLYLNVWTPDPAPAEPRPVMVWLHGGGNVTGSTGNFVPFPPYQSYRFYDAHNLVEARDVVVVSANYRLGAFGFFGHAALAGEDAEFPYGGNQGLLDQRAAFEWVRDNIAAFGGDPNNVTIFGESAGSFDVCVHVMSPMSRGLFHRAISQSGGCVAGIATAEDAAARASFISAEVGCEDAADELACLRAVPVADLLAAYGLSEAALDITGTGISIDGGFLPAHPRALIEAEDFARIPYMLGANSDEGTLFFIGSTPITTAEEYQAVLLERYGPAAPEVEARYPLDEFDSPQDALIRVYGDSRLVCTTYSLAARLAAKRNRTYVYNFARIIPLPFVSLLDLGAFHGAEIPYVFGSMPLPAAATDGAIRDWMQEYWTRFAARGVPRATKASGWPRFNGKRYSVLRFNTTLTKLKGYRKAECDFWSALYEYID